MLDVLHYLFESDFDMSTAEQMDAKDKVRDIIYRDFYEKSYKYGSKKKSANYDYGLDDLDDPVNLEPIISKETKPYFPPTPFNPDAANPFGGVLREAPLG